MIDVVPQADTAQLWKWLAFNVEEILIIPYWIFRVAERNFLSISSP